MHRNRCITIEGRRSHVRPLGSETDPCMLLDAGRSSNKQAFGLRSSPACNGHRQRSGLITLLPRHVHRTSTRILYWFKMDAMGACARAETFSPRSSRKLVCRHAIAWSKRSLTLDNFALLYSDLLHMSSAAGMNLSLSASEPVLESPEPPSETRRAFVSQRVARAVRGRGCRTQINVLESHILRSYQFKHILGASEETPFAQRNLYRLLSCIDGYLQRVTLGLDKNHTERVSITTHQFRQLKSFQFVIGDGGQATGARAAL